MGGQFQEPSDSAVHRHVSLELNTEAYKPQGHSDACPQDTMKLCRVRMLRSERLLMESDQLHPALWMVCSRRPVDTNPYKLKPLTENSPVGA